MPWLLKLSVSSRTHDAVISSSLRTCPTWCMGKSSLRSGFHRGPNPSNVFALCAAHEGSPDFLLWVLLWKLSKAFLAFSNALQVCCFNNDSLRHIEPTTSCCARPVAVSAAICSWKSICTGCTSKFIVCTSNVVIVMNATWALVLMDNL